MLKNNIFTPGNVAIITGAASGIGKAMCKRFAQGGMSVCLVDLASKDLDKATEEIDAMTSKGGVEVLKVPTDVSEPSDIEALHRKVIARLGKVNVLVNNAVTRIGRGYSADLSDWRRAMEVNFWGVVYAVRTFLPNMLSMDEPGMIINVGSKQGITNPPDHPIYNITKAALKAYAEALEHELRTNAENKGENRVSSHLLIPGWTTTGTKHHKSGAWLPDQVVDFMCEALARGDFYILCPDDEVTTQMDHKRILWGAGDIIHNRPPLSRWHPDFRDKAKRECS